MIRKLCLPACAFVMLGVASLFGSDEDDGLDLAELLENPSPIPALYKERLASMDEKMLFDDLFSYIVVFVSRMNALNPDDQLILSETLDEVREFIDEDMLTEEEFLKLVAFIKAKEAYIEK